MKIKIFVSQSANIEDVKAFLSALLVLLLKVNGNDTSKFKLDFKKWFAASAGILDQLKLKKDFTRIANTYQLKETFSDEDAAALGKLLKANKGYLEKDNTVGFEYLNLYKDIASSLATDSVPAWKRIEKNVSVLKNSKLNAIFIPESEEGSVEEEPIGVAIKKLKDLAVKLNGRPDKPFFNPKELAALRLKEPKLMSDYATYARQVNTAVKKEIFKFVRASGKELVPLTSLREHLKRLNLVNNLPTGFLTGKIDETGKMYTKEERQLDKIPFGSVQMNPKYDPETDNTYVLSNVDMPTLRYRTINFNQGNKAKRHTLVKEFFKTESSSRKKWLGDLARNKSKEQILSAMVELLYQTSCRIGGKDNATKGEPTYGLTTLKVKWMKFNPSNIQFNYTGKKLAEQEHVFKTNTAESKKIKDILKELVKNKQPDDLIFTFKGKPIIRHMVNVYLKSLGIEITAHKFRQLSGTKLAMGIINKSKFKTDGSAKQSVVDKWLKDELIKVGSMLHHKTGTKVTGMTAVKSYIDPDVLAEFYDKLGLRKPRWVP
jgi:hypothetical protein